MKVLQFPTLQRRQQVQMDRVSTLHNLPENTSRLTVDFSPQSNQHVNLAYIRTAISEALCYLDDGDISMVWECLQDAHRELNPDKHKERQEATQ